jgi:HK97 family phage prohead protease
MNKIFKNYETKGFTEIKDIDLKNRQVAIYLSKFNVIDSDDDMILSGSFKKSINENGPNSQSNRKIQFLRHHDWEHQIGKFVELNEDENGLFAVGQLGTSTKGEDALRDYDEGIINEHSIGFQYIADKIKWIDDSERPNGGFFQIHELKLWEGSAVTFGANEHTNVLDVVKTMNDKVNEIQKITEQIDLVVKSINNGRGSDERFHQLTMKLKFLNARLVEVVATKPIEKNHFAGSNETKNAFDWEKVNKLIKL